VDAPRTIPHLLPAALLASGLAIGLALGLVTRPLRAADPGAASISGPTTGDGAAPPRAPVTAFPPVARPDDDEGGEAAPAPARSTSTAAEGARRASPEGVTRAAARAALQDLARADAPLAASLEMLLAAARALPLPEGTTRGAIAGRVFRAGPPGGESAERGAPLEGAPVAALPEPPEHDRRGLPWPAWPTFERERALVDLAVSVQSLRTARERGGIAVTGPDGAYAITDLPEGAYTIAGTARGRFLEPASGTAEASPGERVDLVARPGRVVVVRAILDTGEAASGAHLMIDAVARRFQGEADARGVRAVEVPAERITVRAVHYSQGGSWEGEATLEVPKEGPAPVVTVRLEDTSATPALSGKLLGLPGRGARPARGLEVRARPLAPGRALASVTALELRRAPHVEYIDGTSDGFAFGALPPGAYAVAVVHDADVGPASLATLGDGPARVDLQVPPSGAEAGEALRVRLRDAQGRPVARRAVNLRGERAGRLQFLCRGETDDAGSARLLLDRRALEEEVAVGAALRIAVRNRDERWVYHLAPEPFAPGGENVIVVPDPAVLVVTVPDALRAALGGGDGILRLCPPDVSADDDSLGRERDGEIPVDGRVVLGPVGAGAAVLHVLATSGNGSGAGRAPLTSLALDLPPGVTELELPAVPSRALRTRAPGPGLIHVVVGRGPAPPDDATSIGVDAAGLVEIPRAPARPVVLAFVPAGGLTVVACALAPPGFEGEVTLSADQGRGLRAVVLRAARADEATGAALGLERGDVIEAVDGVPVEDALRPFGDRLDPAAPPTPLRLSIRRGARTLEVDVAPRALRAAIEGTFPPFVGPAPPAN